MAMLQDVEDEFPIKGNIQALAFQMAGDVVFDRTVVRMLAHEFDLVVGDDEVDDIVLGIFGDDRSAFDSAREFGPVHRDDALEVIGDDAPIIGELPFDEPRPDVDIAELDGQVIPDRRDFYRFRDIRRQLAGNF